MCILLESRNYDYFQTRAIVDVGVNRGTAGEDKDSQETRLSRCKADRSQAVIT